MFCFERFDQFISPLSGSPLYDCSICTLGFQDQEGDYHLRSRFHVVHIAGLYYAGAYYLGEFRGQHTWHNFAASGAAAGAASALWLLRPFRVRPIMFASVLGAALGSSGALAVSMLGQPFWEEGHDFEGYFLGSKVNLKAKPKQAADQQTQAQ
ncbi:hypothetical protein Vretimale_14064 [Volvox reticuliferus]|uniref:Uncharacterized protein n=1 Tax=Volvox reticuliferus TaxID=1737510 RepID=A0A8J4CQX7_9CHLO|nr:hypothetical protein Vretifemale_16239 [Volvox reticuliferus]GIM10279.1 hypothetical protein Vretimale_14064 [Volvox reticuliferus]